MLSPEYCCMFFFFTMHILGWSHVENIPAKTKLSTQLSRKIVFSTYSHDNCNTKHIINELNVSF